MSRWAAADLVGVVPLWVVTLELAGTQFRIGTQSFSVVNDAGKSLRIDAGLTLPEIEKSAPFLGKSETRTASIEMRPPFSYATLRTYGINLVGRSAEIALIRPGDTWEQRKIQLSGVITGLSWGSDGQPLQIDLEESIQQERGLIGNLTVTDRSWPNAPDSVKGAIYPVILGNCGGGSVPGAPALPVDDVGFGGDHRSYLVVAAHPVAATSAIIFCGDNSEGLAVSQIQDADGNVISVVDMETATTVAWDLEEEYYSSWVDAGHIASAGGNPAGAGGIISLVCAYSSLRIDWGSVQGLADWLDQYRIGATITDPTAPLQWIEDALLPVLPVVLVTGPDGWRLLRINLAATSADCCATLRAVQRSTIAILDGLVETQGYADLINDVTLKYFLDYSLDDTTKSARMSAVFGADTHGDAALAAAQTLGVKQASADSVVVYDDATAYLILRWKALAFSRTREVLRYLVPGSWAWIEPGDLLRLVDEELQIDAPAYVQAVSMLSSGWIRLELVVWQ